MARRQRNRTLRRVRKPVPGREGGVRGAVQAPGSDGRKVGGICAAAAGLHLLGWIALRAHWLAPLFNDSVHRFGPGADFFALYQAGYSALHGQSIYRFIPGHTIIPYAYPFRYLPIAAYTAGALLTLVPPAAAYALWLGLCELCLLYNVSITHRRCGGGTRGALLAALWLLFAPYFLELWVGQFTFLLGCMLFWSVLAWEDGRRRAAQGWWMAAVLWKPAPLLWLPMWVRDRRRWRGVAFLVTALAAQFLYFRFFPADWSAFARENLAPLPAWHAGNVGLTGLIYQLCGPTAAFSIVRWIATAALLVPALWVTFRPPRRPHAAEFDPDAQRSTLPCPNAERPTPNA
jgi:hypothetical protein